ncbi:MAG: peptide chain release factor N(5)-glutamine methyltransferase [Bacteroidales bacterium]|nr:peptide chain release factor N(5)-glutamine methyltransferase [Bacteroidales bacterium]
MRIPSNKVCDIERFAYQELENLYPKSEIKTFVLMLFEHFLGWNTAHFLAFKNSTINQSDLLKFNFAIKDLRNGKPIQYIIGNVEFCDAVLSVSPDVLIPRPETAELVYLIADNEKERSPQHILDLCTGSGCIAIALAKAFPSAMVFAFDISAEAMAVAQKNAECNHANVSFLIADILREENPAGESYDIIVSNPPYVRDMEKTMMNRNVLDYEPHLALFVPDDDPLIFYRHIAEFATKHLKTGGKLYLEINEALGNETAALLEKQGYRCIVHKDSFGKDRMIEAVKS